MLSLSTPESELYAAVKTASEGSGSNAELDKAKHVDMHNLSIQEAS